MSRKTKDRRGVTPERVVYGLLSQQRGVFLLYNDNFFWIYNHHGEMKSMEELLNLLKDISDGLLWAVVGAIMGASSIVTLIGVKIKEYFYAKNVGISRIHKRGRNLKSMTRTMKKASCIKILGFMPIYFIRDHQELLVDMVRNGSRIKILTSDPQSPLIKELCLIERQTEDDIANDYPALINLLKCIKAQAGSESTGSIELRKYHTEIRNPVIICEDKKGKKVAFLTVSLPPKRSIDVMMLEFCNRECLTVEGYFDKIWERHSGDVGYYEK